MRVGPGVTWWVSRCRPRLLLLRGRSVAMFENTWMPPPPADPSRSSTASSIPLSPLADPVLRSRSSTAAAGLKAGRHGAHRRHLIGHPPRGRAALPTRAAFGHLASGFAFTRAHWGAPDQGEFVASLPSTPPATTPRAVLPALLIQSVGAAMGFTPTAVVIRPGPEAEDAGFMSGLLQTTQQVAGSLGFAITVAYMPQVTTPPPFPSARARPSA